METAIVDFSALFHRLWHVNHAEAVHNTLKAVRRLEEPRVIIAVDSPPYDRKQISPEYKSNRDVPDPELIGQLHQTLDELANDGYEIARCQGWEADDVIGTLVQSIKATVYGADKDLLQVTDIKDPLSHEEKTPECLGVQRDQVVDYLCMVGDTSDNVRGVEGIGPKTAVRMLAKFGNWFAIVDAVRSGNGLFADRTRENITKALDWMDTTRELVTIRTDLDVEIEKRERSVVEIQAEPAPKTAIEPVREQPTHIATVNGIGFKQALEPLGPAQAWEFAVTAHRSGLYPQFKGPEQIMMVVMRGRPLGLEAVTALDAYDMIQGRPRLKAVAIAGLIMAHPSCQYLRCEYFGDDKSVWETLRVGHTKPIVREFTMDEAVRAGDNMQPEYRWANGKKSKTGKMVVKENWIKRPGVMLQNRCVSAIGRQVYPDVMFMLGIYSREELE